MKSSRIVLILVVAITAAPTIRAEPPLLGPRHGVLLLANGELIAGEITGAGDRYDVNREGTELHVRASDVRLVADDAGACYRFLREHLSANTASTRLELADWCLRQNLLDSARAEIDAARAADANHPKLEAYELRWKAATTPEPPREKTTSAPAPVTAAELDRLIRDMPEGSVETFTSVIQPILLNNCSTAGCHGPSSTSSLRLLRAAGRQPVSRRSTQRNLLSVLGTINRASPLESPLLTTPMEPHGGTKTPIFTNHSAAQRELLMAWVDRIARDSRKGRAPASVGEPAGGSLLQSIGRGQGMKSRAASGDMKETNPASATTDEATQRLEDKANSRPFGQPFDGVEEAAGAASGQSLTPRNNARRGVDLSEQFVPSDPFDPEIFNRRFFGEPRK